MWVRKALNPTKTEPHQCLLPTTQRTYGGNQTFVEMVFIVPDGQIGDLWRCDTCKLLWKIVRSQPDYHTILDFRWKPAGWWNRFWYSSAWDKPKRDGYTGGKSVDQIRPPQPIPSAPVPPSKQDNPLN